MDYHEYLELFKINTSDVNKVLQTALSHGARFADLYFEYSVANSLTLKEHIVGNAASHQDYGVGIRAVKGECTGYAYAESTELEDMLRAARVAASIADSNNNLPLAIGIQSRYDFQQVGRPAVSPYHIEKGWNEYTVKQKVPVLQTLEKSIFSKGDEFVKVICSLRDSLTHVLYFNSESETFCDTMPMVTLIAQCVGQKDGKIENGSCSRSFRCGFEMLTDELIEEVASRAAAQCRFMFTAKQPKGGEMPVVLASGASGILLHEAVGHAFEADFIRKGTSIFTDSLGKRICNKGINIVDSGLVQRNRGSLNFDDEGIPSQETYLVRDGVLESFMHDRISANYFGVKSTGNGRREDFRFPPIPRMRCTYMESGDCEESQAIASVRNGIFVKDFSNGQVQIGEGDFTFFVKAGYLIENGHLTQPVKDINIIGNGPQVLKDITMVCNNAEIANSSWVCGKEQQCAVSCGMPTVAVSKLIVGGES